ncbi:MAG: hypothetical protein ACLPT4_06305 [Verrucomicrobiia bacterium]
MKPIILTILAGLLLASLAAQSLGVWVPGGASIITPLPFPLIWLAFASDGAFLLVIALLPSLAFWLWSPGLFRGKATIPIRSIILFAIGLVASIVWFVGGWRYGLKYESLTYNISTALFSAVLAVCTGVLILRTRKSPSFTLSLLTHFVLFAWLITYAFPYLGELP